MNDLGSEDPQLRCSFQLDLFTNHFKNLTPAPIPASALGLNQAGPTPANKTNHITPWRRHGQPGSVEDIQQDGTRGVKSYIPGVIY